jgi:hypothetical protein
MLIFNRACFVSLPRAFPSKPGSQPCLVLALVPVRLELKFELELELLIPYGSGCLHSTLAINICYCS